MGQDKYYGQGDKGHKKQSDLAQMNKQTQKPMQKLSKRESEDQNLKKSKSVRKQKVIEEKVIYFREAEFVEVPKEDPVILEKEAEEENKDAQEEDGQQINTEADQKEAKDTMHQRVNY